MTNLLKQNLSELNEKMATLKKEIQEKSKVYFTELFKEFGARHQFYAVVWTQYTPYFNDGEECYFSVNDINLKLTEESYDDDHYECDSYLIDRIADMKKRLANEDYGYYKTKERCNEVLQDAYEKLGVESGDEIDPETYATIEAFSELKSEVGKIDDEYMEMTFGNHVKVTFFKETLDFVVDEYDHD